MSTTTLTEIDRDYHEGTWPVSRQTIVVLVGGELADRVRRHFNRIGPVFLHQYGKEDLARDEYSEVRWVWDSVLTVGVEQVRRELCGEATLVDDGKGHARVTRLLGTSKMARFLNELEQVGA